MGKPRIYRTPRIRIFLASEIRYIAFENPDFYPNPSFGFEKILILLVSDKFLIKQFIIFTWLTV